MKDHDPNTESSNLMYWDVSKLYGPAMRQKFPVNDSRRKNFTQKFIWSYEDDSDKGCILELDVSYPKHLPKIHSDFLFLPERMNIDKFQKLACN